MRFTDIVLDESELAQIETEIETYNQKVYGGTMEASSKRLLRQKLMQEYKEGVWANRDYVYGQDEGEPPKGAQW
jgi:hypothetical protein